MATTAATLGAELAEKSQALALVFEKHNTPDGLDMPPELAADCDARMKEINAIGERRDAALALEAMAAKNAERVAALTAPVRNLPFPTGGNSQGSGHGLNGIGLGAHQHAKQAVVRGFADAFVDAFYEKDARTGSLIVDSKGLPPLRIVNKEVAFDLPEYKTTLTTTAGWAPETIRSGRLVPYALRMPMVADMLPTIPVGPSDLYKYMTETVFTNAAAETAEGGAKPEAEMAFAEASEEIAKIAVWIPVTKEQLQDVPGMRAIVENRLGMMVQLRLDSQLIAGDNVGENINGFFTRISQAQAKGADPTFDAVHKAIVKCQTIGFANPTAIVMHPNDWQDIRLTRTADGIYILGNPADAGPERLWGLPVKSTTACTENTALVGDFAGYSALLLREGLTFDATNSHASNFTSNIWVILCEMRAALAVFRATAFCKVTGI